MAVHTKGLQHFYERKGVPEKDKFKKFYDKIIYIIVIICPLLNLPQLYNVWIEKSVAGVSVVSWLGFSFISLTWLIYGIVHKDNHILIMNSALMVIQALVGIGVIVYS